MKRSKTILVGMAMVAALFFILAIALTGSSATTANAQPAPEAPIPNQSVYGTLTGSEDEASPDATQGLDFEFNKWVARWGGEGQGQADCDAAKYQKVLVVNYGDFVRYCYEGRNVGTTTVITHTMYDDKLGYAMKDYRYERVPGADIAFYTRNITITEETVNTAWWKVIDENGSELTRYQKNTVKVAIRFRGYTFDALPSDPAPKPKLAGVALELYGWDEGDLITESLRMTTTSDADGWWNFYMPDTYDHYQVRALPPSGYVAVDAWAEYGQKVQGDTLQWDAPDRSIVQNAQFYFAIPTPSPTPTITPTPTDTPTPPPGMEPGIWLPLMVSQ